jgi:hypothetical protein
MTVHKSFKRLVRARMEKTGQSYTAARASLLAADDTKPTAGPGLAVSDGVIRERTGRGWEDWFDLLDNWGAVDRPAKEIRRWLREQHGVESWGSQAVAIGFERARGLRAVGEHADGFAITATKTVAVPVERLYAAFVDPSLRRRWLPDAELRQRTVIEPRSARFDWGDGTTRVHVTFAAKGEEKSTASLQHERLADAAEADRMKAFWRERVSAMKQELER